MRYLVIAVSLLYLLHAFDGKTPSWEVYNPKSIDIIKLGPPNYQLYEYMKVYSKEYDIPFDYALRCASEETGYQGKFDFHYRPFVDRLRPRQTWRIHCDTGIAPISDRPRMQRNHRTRPPARSTPL